MGICEDKGHWSPLQDRRSSWRLKAKYRLACGGCTKPKPCQAVDVEDIEGVPVPAKSRQFPRKEAFGSISDAAPTYQKDYGLDRMQALVSGFDSAHTYQEKDRLDRMQARGSGSDFALTYQEKDRLGRMRVSGFDIAPT